MRKISSAIILCVSFFVLQGCSDSKRLKQTKTNTNTMDSEQYQDMKQCIKNANVLVNLNEKYKTTLKEIHFLISEAKSYATSNVSGDVEKTITPLFEYKINYKCNEIEQKLIEEYNNKIQSASAVKIQ
ncbi:hypothetical protein ACUAXY_004803 [Escherichia coli]